MPGVGAATTNHGRTPDAKAQARARPRTLAITITITTTTATTITTTTSITSTTTTVTTPPQQCNLHQCNHITATTNRLHNATLAKYKSMY